MTRPPLPPFTDETARLKVRTAENAWNTRNPDIVTPAYTDDSVWRNRNEFATGHAEIHALLTRKWTREHEYRLAKELWTFAGLPMNGTTVRKTGFAGMAMKTGNSHPTAEWPGAMQASTTLR